MATDCNITIPELIIASVIDKFDEFTIQDIVNELNDKSIPEYLIIRVIDKYIDYGRLISNGVKFLKSPTRSAYIGV